MSHQYTSIELPYSMILAELSQLVRLALDESERDLLEIDNIDATTELASLPLDSLATVELMYSIEERFGVVVTEEHAFEFRTVGDVIGFIRSNRTA